MHAYERMTFLLVTGVLGLFLLSFVFAVMGAVLTLYPNAIPQLRRRYAVLANTTLLPSLARLRAAGTAAAAVLKDDVIEIFRSVVVRKLFTRANAFR